MRNRSLVPVVFVLLCLAAPVAAQDIGKTGSGPYFVIQPGAGVDIRLTDRLAARVQGDWRRIFSADKALGIVDSNQIRIAAGIVVGFGSR